MTKQQTQVRVQVEVRPSSLDGFDYVTLFDETFHLDHANDMDPEKIEELYSTVITICKD